MMMLTMTIKLNEPMILVMKKMHGDDDADSGVAADSNGPFDSFVICANIHSDESRGWSSAKSCGWSQAIGSRPRNFPELYSHEKSLMFAIPWE